VQGHSASDDEVRALAAEILGQDEYAAFRGDLAAWLERFFQWVEELQVTSPALFWLLMAGLLLVALLLIAHATWTIRIALRAPPPDEDVDTRVSAADWLGRARTRAREGHFLEAARHLQLATLEDLLERGVIELSRSEPNRVLRARLAAAGLPASDRDALLGGLDGIEAALFRDRREDPELYETWLALHARLARVGAAS
jgi:hypothetical protein